MDDAHWWDWCKVAGWCRTKCSCLTARRFLDGNPLTGQVPVSCMGYLWELRQFRNMLIRFGDPLTQSTELSDTKAKMSLSVSGLKKWDWCIPRLIGHSLDLSVWIVGKSHNRFVVRLVEASSACPFPSSTPSAASHSSELFVVPRTIWPNNTSQPIAQVFTSTHTLNKNYSFWPRYLQTQTHI